MAKVVGLSGPQGAGKSTLLQELRGTYHVDDFKVSREIQRRLGWQSLEKVKESAATMMMFQESILEAKAEREEFNRRRTDVDIVLTERTFADIFAYASLWAKDLMPQDEADWFSLDFFIRCMKEQAVYDAVIYLPFMDHVAWEEDCRRASQGDIQFVAHQLEHFTQTDHVTPLLVLTGITPQERAAEVVAQLKNVIHNHSLPSATR